MAPLIVQIITTVIARWKLPLRDAVRAGLAVMFLFTAVSHFSPLRHSLAAMIPPPLTGAMWVIYLTGVLEAAGAVGLLVRPRAAGWFLIALLLAMFPANVYAALQHVPLGDRAASALWWRAPLQLFWIALLWWCAAKHPSNAPLFGGRTATSAANGSIAR